MFRLPSLVIFSPCAQSSKTLWNYNTGEVKNHKGTVTPFNGNFTSKEQIEIGHEKKDVALRRQDTREDKRCEALIRNSGHRDVFSSNRLLVRGWRGAGYLFEMPLKISQIIEPDQGSYHGDGKILLTQEFL